jgi:hypothetical protein
MKIMKRRISTSLLVVMFFISTTGFEAASAGAQSRELTAGSEWLRDPQSGFFVYYAKNGEASCVPPDDDELRSLVERDSTLPLKEIDSEGDLLQAAAALKVVLRGTSQLDGFPQAKAAFLRAAAQWSALVQADITVVIDVDFGPTRFGTPFNQEVLGSADSQQLGSRDGYADIRASLIARAGSAGEITLYNALPQSSVPTDIGNTSLIFAPSAALRALGVIGPVADPDGERAQFGPPPSIGFNSNFNFDFDPTDGTTPGQIDFVTVATHEIGHVLGFSSLAGAKELNPAMDTALSIWDLFRFRPGAATASIVPADFTSALRVLSSGGEQVFSAGGAELRLSTGRPNASGGDGFQASHWKNDSLTGVTLGIMDPDLASGTQQAINESDLKVLDAIGYGAAIADEGGSKLKKVTFSDSKLTIKGTGLAGQVQLVVNFTVVAPPLRIKGSDKKLKINGSQADLNLRNGANLVQVIRDGLRSNVVVVNL